MHPTCLTRRHFLGAAAALCASAAHAQAWPARPIRIVVPYPAGGSTDQLARAIQQPLAQALGQAIVIDNRAGAGGTIGMDHVAKAAPDGYTLGFGNTGPNAVAGLLRKLPYDPVADLAPVSTVALTPMILAVPADSPAQTLPEFLAYARREGGRLNYGSVGNASLSHLTGEYFNDLANLKMQHIPYNGGAPMLAAFVGGQLQAAFVTGLDGAAMLASGRVRYLAVATSAATDGGPRLPPLARDVPGFESIAWFGILAPRAVPQEVISRLHAAVVAAVNQPEVRKLFTERRVEARASTPAELQQRIGAEAQQWGQVIRKAGVTG
ncbi:MAG TPA: tripartite tricarboxylate transporter substrate binding protein [Burkholderiaceae bacterium]|nr:tripartite tricarboxylate transporter substrate binding protein [Burkholderiaceae bacterium]